MSEKKQILMVFTGGTISSRIHKMALELGTAPYYLLASYRKKDCVFDIIEPISVLSENITPEMYRILFSAIAKKVASRKYSAVLIAHGTDTMAYTAQLSNLLLSRLPIPVILFGSKIPPEAPDSDAPSNLKLALSLSSQITGGVYVVSRASDRKNYVHHAGLIQSADSKTNDFSSFQNQYAGKIVRNTYTPNPDFVSPPTFREASSFLTKLKKLSSLPPEQTVLCIDACCCINYSNYLVSTTSYKYVIVRAHHSCTANALSEDNPYSLLFLKKSCDGNGKRIFFGPCEFTKPLYSTTKSLLDSGIVPIRNMPFESAWATLVLCSWISKKPDKYLK